MAHRKKCLQLWNCSDHPSTIIDRTHVCAWHCFWSWRCVRAKLLQSCSTLCDPMDCSPQGSFVHGIFQAGMLKWIATPSSRGSSWPDPGIEPRSPALQVISLPAEPQERPKNTGVGSLSLLQGIFPTQGSNPGLPYCRQILYQLSHKGSSVW